MITIDGSQGEGGGQIVRSSLALSLVTGQPVTIENVRAKRSRPGLMRQHLTAFQAAAEIGKAVVEGDAIGSSKVMFHPHELSAGEYNFNIGTAGSTMLVLQTVLPALMVADGPSQVILEGGTHNPFAPPFDFLQKAYAPLVARLGPKIEMTLERPGFYPAGGGRAIVSIEPAGQLKTISLLDRGSLSRRSVRALVSNLPAHIGERECRRVINKCNWGQESGSVEEVTNARGPGNALIVEIESQHVTEVFTSFGEKGRPAEAMAEKCVKQVRRYLKGDVPVGEYLADQLILPLAIGAGQGTGGGQFRTLSLSPHSTTHLDVVQRFLDIQVEVEEKDRDETIVSIQPATTK
jgi:RNA 3'-terminal phosphate cyclase (ATP)